MRRKRDISKFDIHIKADDKTYIYVERWKNVAFGGRILRMKFGVNLYPHKLKVSEIQYNIESKKWTLTDYTIRKIT